MIYVLMINLAIGGGFAAEFSSQDACEDAGRAYVQRMERHQLSWYICVPKGK
jgi:hypothetical protein